MIRASKLDESLGMRYYVLEDVYVGDLVTHDKSPNTFKVFEISLDGIKASLDVCNQIPPKTQGNYVHMVMCKEGIDTIHAIFILRKIFKSKVGYAGMKDADSYSCQFISARADEPDLTNYYDLGKIKVCLFKYANYPIRKGYLLANHFNVYLRLKRSSSYERLYHVFKSLPNKYVPNYYGYQRFGTIRPITHLVGKAIVKRSWDEAVRLIGGNALPTESSRVINARKAFDAGNYREALKYFPDEYLIERRVTYAMIKYGDSFKALKYLGRDLLNLYVEAYQSYLFNMLLSELLTYFNGIDGLRRTYETVLVPGYGLSLRNDVYSHTLKRLLSDEDVSLKEFSVRELGVYGKYYVRESVFNVIDLSYSMDCSGIWLNFTLPRGSYASILLRELLRDTHGR